MTDWTDATLVLTRQPDGTFGGTLTYDGVQVDVQAWTKASPGVVKCQLRWQSDGWVEDYVARNGKVLRGG